jgi:glyoxylase-like metal-dependent hydrolase (beta-lactamase superfamily II)
MNRVHPLSCGLGYAFLIETPEGLFLVDSGSPGQYEKVLAKMKQLGRSDLKFIWITHAHYDHFGSAAALGRLTGAKIAVHRADADCMINGRSLLGVPRNYGFIYFPGQQVVGRIRPLPKTPSDFALEDGDSLERFGLDATVLHTPGHTPGHSGLLLEGGIAFAGDLVTNSPRPGLQALLATDWSRMPGSLAKLQAAKPDWVYTGHSGKAMSGEELQRIQPGSQYP